MGDFADMALSDTMDMEDLRSLYRSGGMSEQQAYDEGIVDELGFYKHVPMFGSRRDVPMFNSTQSRSKRCKYCGKTGLKWSLTQSGYRLADSDGQIHSCGAYAALAAVKV